MQICSNCHAGCCRKFNAHLTGYDILKIKRNLGLDYLYFVQIAPVKEENIDKIIEQTALFKFTNLGNDEYYTFHMKRVKSRYFPDSYKCMFLQEWDGEDFLLPVDKVISRCGIYESKPLTCSIFPSKLHDDGLIGVSGNPKNNNTTGNPAYDLCPRLLEEKDIEDFSDNAVQNLVLYKYEMDYFKSLAKVWNEYPSDFARFIAYLEAAYKNRILFNESEK
ncbi:MAG: hypothetical protein A2287_07630 [Candidatus Melainabacteria bacterium RIFOXYA12_FULL_32_12]|nr:MAG: hypothetical protein A2255_02510 [Candidatus Melainabacteria bacterium RIFOXYA2_FULL_32_9]OGI30186.1 MAG: hypothetical protein A2287_07630 [Candidatus Melainabacteria bacterium RIFOXYA12_FULL_32_12]